MGGLGILDPPVGENRRKPEKTGENWWPFLGFGFKGVHLSF
jgi:hypothetical protein